VAVKKLSNSISDMTLCPLCAQPNNCAAEIEKSTSQKQEPCWCVSVEFPKELLAQLPKDAAGCICNKCVSEAISQSKFKCFLNYLR